jgi:hypothetical protein
MVAPVTIGGGISVGSGVKVGNHGIYQGVSTVGYQNVAGSDDTTGFFFQGGGGWITTPPNPTYYDIQPGWTVVGLPGATVVSTDPGAQTVTITGGTFTSGAFYSFTGN